MNPFYSYDDLIISFFALDKANHSEPTMVMKSMNILNDSFLFSLIMILHMIIMVDKILNHL